MYSIVHIPPCREFLLHSLFIMSTVIPSEKWISLVSSAEKEKGRREGKGREGKKGRKMGKGEV